MNLINLMRIFGFGRKGTSFDGLSDEQIEAHAKVKKYGDFVLSDGISPSYDLKVVPITGFRHHIYRDPVSGNTPVITISLSREIIFSVFIDLISLLGDMVNVVLETSHDSKDHSHIDLFRENMDFVVLESVLYDFEDVLVDDGCTAIAVLNRKRPIEIQLDEHKLIIVYYRIKSIKKEVLKILRAYNVPQIPNIKFISEVEHIHTTENIFREQFEKLKRRLGVENE